MNKYLTQQIWKMRKNIRSSDDTPFVSLEKVEGGEYQLLFLSCGCENACTFCNYGFDYNLTLEMVKPELEKIRLEDFEIEELILEANGSFLSEREIPYDLFLEALKFVAHRNIPSIAMETHYKTITEQKLKDIRRILGDEQDISFELGFESSSEDVRAIYNKDIDIDEFKKVSRLCEKYNIRMIVNVLLGAPFLSRENQIQDCLETLRFIYSELPEGTRAVLFPINIKENTMLRHWQEIGVYDQISSWEFVELLHRIPTEYLDRLTIAWWGTRENAFTKGEIQHPKTCPKCVDRLIDFYVKFYLNHGREYRKQIIEEIWKSRCDCDVN